MSETVALDASDPRASAPAVKPAPQRARIGYSRFLGGELTQESDDAAMTTRSLFPAGLDLYRALLVGGPLTTRELAERTGFEERRVREWLGGEADRGHVTYDSKAEIFLLTPEQAARVDGGAAF